MRGLGSPYGIHRVVAPLGDLPQGADRLDSSLPIYSNELLIQVERLNVDSTSFKQLWELSLHDENMLRRRILEIVRERGKLHNPVTNSGGMLIGTLAERGKDYHGGLKTQIGDRIATLVSLALTPLSLEEITDIDLKTGQVAAKGHAILFETGIACALPKDLPEAVSLAVLDVCGAPALVARHVRKNDRVLFIGAGKSAKLSAAGLRKQWKDHIHIACVDIDAHSLEEMRSMGLADEVFQGDATLVRATHASPLQNAGYDVVINVANVPGSEMTSLMAVKEKGTVIFFGMGTSFQRVALGAEGIGKDATFLIGSGFVQGHAELALNLVREHEGLRKWFERRSEK